jgi:cytoskeletal protein CcmA (bactofilin family)
MSNSREEQYVLDNFRKRDLPQSPQTPRVQSPYSRLQEALSPVAPEAPKPDAIRIETPKPLPPAPREEAKLVRADEGKPSKLIVGPDIKLKGAEITDCDTLIVEGRVEASMDSRVIQISERGVFAGKAGIDVAEIRGCFEGELTARKQLLICSTGKVSGKIRYGKLAVEEGGEISGDVGALTDSAKGSSTRGATTTVPALARPAG